MPKYVHADAIVQYRIGLHQHNTATNNNFLLFFVASMVSGYWCAWGGERQATSAGSEQI